MRKRLPVLVLRSHWHWTTRGSWYGAGQYFCCTVIQIEYWSTTVPHHLLRFLNGGSTFAKSMKYAV